MVPFNNKSDRSSHFQSPKVLCSVMKISHEGYGLTDKRAFYQDNRLEETFRAFTIIESKKQRTPPETQAMHSFY